MNLICSTPMIMTLQPHSTITVTILSEFEQPSALNTEPVLERGVSLRDDTYLVGERFGRGNSGEVYFVESPRYRDRRVLKLFVPFYAAKQRSFDVDADKFSEFMLQNIPASELHDVEFGFLSQLDHPFVVKVHDHGVHALSRAQIAKLKLALGGQSRPSEEHYRDTRLPFIISAHVRGQAFADAVVCLGRYRTFRVLSSLVETVEYLHRDHQILHLDIKSTNVLVRQDGYPVLLDFALAKDLSQSDGDEIIRGGIDSSLTPPRHISEEISSFIDRVLKMGVTKAEFRRMLFPGLDLYQVGLMIRECIGKITPYLTPAEGKYLDFLVAELLDWDRVSKMEPGELEAAFRQLDSTSFFLAVRPGLPSSGREMVLSQNRRVFVPKRLASLVDHPELTRLHRLNQLGLLSSEFPGATHSRYEHSLDVMRLAESAARRLLDDPRFRRIFSESDVLVLVAAALLHDVNHLPFTHILQESELPYLRATDQFEKALSQSYQVGSLKDAIDETLGAGCGVRIHKILVKSWQLQEHGPDQVISSLLNSGIDIDKLSYLELDSERSGLSFSGGMDVARILSSMVVVDWEQTDEAMVLGRGLHIAFPETELPLVEEIVRTRVRAFRELYWCDTNRAMMAHFLACLRHIDGVKDGETRLIELIQDVRSETDFTVLRRLDELTAELGIDSFNLSDMFDSLSAFRPMLIYSSVDQYARMRDLDSAGRVEVDHLLREGLETRVPTLVRDGRSLMVDVPRRPLTLGGEIVIRAETNQVVIRGIDRSPVLKNLLEEMRGLSSRVRIFAPADLVEATDLDKTELGQVVGACLLEALGHSTME